MFYMMKSKKKRTKVQELTPETLSQLDQEALISIVMKLYEQNKQLSEQFQAFLQEKYGRKTEKHEAPDQLRIFEPASTGEQAPIQQSPADEEPAPKPKRPGHTRNPMPSHLKKKQLQRQPTDQEISCACGGRRKEINKVVRNRRFECVPMTVFIEEIVDSVWQCPNCHDSIVVEAEVCEPIANGGAGPRLLVKLVEDRWLNHLPWHRQEQMFARQGIDIPRSTMCGWMKSLSLILHPLYDWMKEELLRSKIIATDDTPVKVQDRSKKSNIRRGHEWIYMGDRAHPVNLFHYTPGRGRDGPKQFLKGFSGYLQGDCFSGNRALCAETGATHVACRAHDRRYYVKARAGNKQLCDEMLDKYAALFEIERTARELELSADEVVAMRKQEAVPLLAEMKKWIDEQLLTALPASSFGKALAYSANNWESLNKYLLDGDLRIDNNLAEQQMKLFATGRKNWYFYGSEEAGEQASIMLSLLSTCVRNNVEPGAYLYDVLLRLTENRHCDKDELLPHKWEQKYKSAEIEMSGIPQNLTSLLR
jgi:transposase